MNMTKKEMRVCFCVCFLGEGLFCGVARVGCQGLSPRQPGLHLTRERPLASNPVKPM